MHDGGLTRREEDILLGVLRHYADSRKPVPSASLKGVSGGDLSSSSLRAVLNELEKKGYLSKEHVSSGRVPTDLAYRHFASVALNNLSMIGPAPAGKRRGEASEDVRTMAMKLSKTISERHHSIGFATAPSLLDARLSMCELYPVSRDKVVFLALSHNGRVYEHVLTARRGYPLDALRSFSNYITRNYQGWTFREIRNHLKIQLVRDRERLAGWMIEALSLISPAVEQLPSEVELFWDGLEWLIDMPEMAADKFSMRSLVEAVEKKERLIELLDELLNNGRETTISLGADWPLNLNPPSLALIAVSYGTPGTGKGVVGLIGPKAMKYDEALPNISSSAILLTEAAIGLAYGGRDIG